MDDGPRCVAVSCSTYYFAVYLFLSSDYNIITVFNLCVLFKIYFRFHKTFNTPRSKGSDSIDIYISFFFVSLYSQKIEETHKSPETVRK